MKVLDVNTVSPSENQLKRDTSIDILRFIGLSLIILAHVEPPHFIMELRTFDVPLMLFVSGLTFFNKKYSFSFQTFIKRCVRLLLPVYIFLTFYFLIIFVLKALSIETDITLNKMIESYLLSGGIGYVWIIRIFLIIALLTPLLIWLRDKLTTPQLFLFISGILLFQDLLIFNKFLLDNIIINKFFYYGIGFSIPFLIALKFPLMSSKWQYITIGYFIFLFISDEFIYNKLIKETNFDNSPNQKWVEYNLLIFNMFKYPPQSIYLLYGIVGCLITYMIIVKNHFYKYLEIFSFIGCNTIWIYLYHIPIVRILRDYNINWGIKYFITYLLAFILCYFQIKIVEYLENKYNIKNQLNLFKG